MQSHQPSVNAHRTPSPATRLFASAGGSAFQVDHIEAARPIVERLTIVLRRLLSGLQYEAGAAELMKLEASRPVVLEYLPSPCFVGDGDYGPRARLRAPCR